MGGIWLSRESLVDALVEVAGYKAGVLLTNEAVVPMVAETTIGRTFLADGRPCGRIRSEDFEEAAAQLLYVLGNISSPNTVPATIELFHKYKRDPTLFEIWNGVMEIYLATMPGMLDISKRDKKAINPEPFMRPVAQKFGKTGLDMAMEVITGINRDLHRSSACTFRSVDWEDAVELEGLFKSERLETLHGSFFDQRFIDFLDRNFDRIDDIHWRKFEGLAGEYFDREGYRVEMGPGRGDEGVDMRVFPRDAKGNAPPLILVQCKRQKAKIDMVVVKSVYADVQWEQAESGMIVTTSTFAPGAERIKTARAYNVDAADRPKLREWISRMRSGE